MQNNPLSRRGRQAGTTPQCDQASSPVRRDSGSGIDERGQEVLGSLWTGHFEPHRPVAWLDDQTEAQEPAAAVLGVDDGAGLLHQIDLRIKPQAKASGDALARAGFAQETWQKSVVHRGDLGRRQSARDGKNRVVLTLSVHLRSLDRKSTRLNSSHTVISYAVFCLKK